MKVVIIDDDKLVSMSLKMILENGTDIEVAAVGEDGREAVSLYEKYSPDILLLDIRMQYIDRTGSGKKCACGISGCQNSFPDDIFR